MGREVKAKKRTTKLLRTYFNNHYDGKAVINAIQFKETKGMSLPAEDRKVLERAQAYMLGNQLKKSLKAFLFENPKI